MGRRSGERSGELAAGLAKFEAWRRTRVRGARIPRRLWELAESLAKRHGVSATAQALKVGYYSLQDRLATNPMTSANSSGAEAGSAAFVQLPVSSLGSSSCDCLIELEHEAGRRLRIQWRGSAVPDLAALSREFWENR